MLATATPGSDPSSSPRRVRPTSFASPATRREEPRLPITCSLHWWTTPSSRANALLHDALGSLASPWLALLVAGFSTLERGVAPNYLDAIDQWGLFAGKMQPRLNCRFWLSCPSCPRRSCQIVEFHLVRLVRMHPGHAYSSQTGCRKNSTQPLLLAWGHILGDSLGAPERSCSTVLTPYAVRPSPSGLWDSDAFGDISTSSGRVHV
ncbi:uncharacterized protein J3D65DRAFT_628509 [Phyllosticta citribraziliensis]|uniref:Uncharacterized protein n=1 Tax=Phyllosticta citribraziliensis TaxID=989973 RepID=A0ABR1LQX5_9PEZI